MFAPHLQGQGRHWSIDVSHIGENGWARKIWLETNARTDETVGVNEQCTIENAYDYTIPVQEAGRDLVSVMTEVRQDKRATAPQSSIGVV